MKLQSRLPEDLAATAHYLSDAEQAALWRAAILMADSRTIIMRLTAVFGRQMEALRTRVSEAGDRIGGSTFTDIATRAQDTVEDTLWHSYSLATLGLGGDSANPAPRAARANRLATAASGAVSGFIGLPGIIFDIPFTTTAILRAIARVAREHGEDLTGEETRRACLEVLAFGGPSPVDDETEIGYWTTRAGVNHLTINLLIKAASARFGVVLSQKFLAQAVPLAGALTGAALNYSFTRYYQDMAQVHFTLRALERRTGAPATIRRLFSETVTAARARRRFTRRPRNTAPLAYLPR